MALTSPFDHMTNILQNHYAYENVSTYDREGETQITGLQVAQGSTTGDMDTDYNVSTITGLSLWYVIQSEIDFGSGATPPRSGDKLTVADGTVYHVTAWEAAQGNYNWRLVTEREEM